MENEGYSNDVSKYSFWVYIHYFANLNPKNESVKSFIRKHYEGDDEAALLLRDSIIKEVEPIASKKLTFDNGDICKYIVGSAVSFIAAFGLHGLASFAFTGLGAGLFYCAKHLNSEKWNYDKSKEIHDYLKSNKFSVSYILDRYQDKIKPTLENKI